MPFNIWCGGCERHIARGVRFNAEKKQIGVYLSTPIYSFRMRCVSCSTWIEIHTDPKNSEYVVVEGGRRKQESFDPSGAGIRPEKTKDEAEKLIYNPFYKLEHDWKDERTAKETWPKLQQLIALNEDVWREDFDASKAARHQLRREKAELEAEAKKQRELGERLGAHDLPFLPEDDHDRRLASSIEFVKPDSTLERMAKVKAASVFKKNKSSASSKAANQLLQRAKTKKSASILDQLQL